VFTFDAVAVAYFTAFAVVAPFVAPRGLGRWRGAMSLAAAAVVIAVASYRVPTAVRVWLGGAYLVGGYWLPVILVTTAASDRFEAWLARSDVWCRRASAAMPASAAQPLELSYLLCYLVVPFGFVVVWTSGTAIDIDRFWTGVLLAGFACYGTLPWLVCRPPRLLGTADPLRPSTRLHDLNLGVLSRVSHGHITFPSGHVAVSIAAALMVFPVSGPIGVAMLLVAAGIAAGAVVGGYHYGMDVLGGVAVGVVASLIS
jgi:membrane-associated phospholipid phosphatase